MIDSSSVLSKRLTFFTGKGGVGKSALSVAMGQLHARQGERVLIIEMNARSRVGPLYGRSDVGYEPVRIDDNLYVINVTPREALEEYMRIVFKFRFVADRVIHNSLFKVFTKALPGMDDLVTMGKIWYLERDRQRNGKPTWDRLIVDAPATGHGITFLRFPQVAIDTVRVGPIAKSAEDIRDMLLDETKTSVNLVTLPEELPVNETIELYQSLEDIVGVPFGFVFINAVYPRLFSDKATAFIEDGDPEILRPVAGEHAEGMLDAARTQTGREALNRRHIERLKAAVPAQFIELPLIFSERFDRHAIEAISHSLEESLPL